MTAEERNLDQRVLRTLLRQGGEMKEGKLAAFCRRGVFMESWRDGMERLTASGLLAIRFNGHGNSRTLSLTEAGKAKAEEAKAEANQLATKEILDAVKETAQ